MNQILSKVDNIVPATLDKAYFCASCRVGCAEMFTLILIEIFAKSNCSAVHVISSYAFLVW